ncbi:Tyrosine recombinase XerC [Limihaloglobus sulfuriphilus]|uniref:Tyrosine recombinase XerC n=1 Tax=Limihaloglobus sulfuriphilus TaxID=1851148 RepID=A0A1Q2MEM9_9BACT|nr:tyrosine-type recombinase/integrase [Limihaloglobus sulfuriphilus]AQQ71163.1 Tyrosine recombinase XerC [Limihaloglobus sulfuriphilus]
MRIRNEVTITRDKRSPKPWKVRWWGKYDITSEKQQRYSRSFKTKKEAEKFAQSLKEDIEDGISVEPKVVTLGNLCDQVFEAKKMEVAPTTLRLLNETILRLKSYFGNHRNIKTLRRIEAEGFIRKLKRLDARDGDVSDSTKHRHLRMSKTIFNKALDWDYIKKNPFKGITLGKIKTQRHYYIRPQEFNALMQAIDKKVIRKDKKSNIREKQDNYNKAFMKAFYSVMYGCGFRFGEVANLMWDDGNIDFKNSIITTFNRESRDGLPPFRVKDFEARSVEAPSWVMNPLTQMRQFRTPDNPYVFLSHERYLKVKDTWARLVAEGKEGKWLNSMLINNTNRQLKFYCKKAGIITSDRLSIHCLRKAYGTNLANLNTPIHTLKSLMGHGSVSTTMKYYILSSDENKLKAVEKLERLIGA